MLRPSKKTLIDYHQSVVDGSQLSLDWLNDRVSQEIEDDPKGEKTHYIIVKAYRKHLKRRIQKHLSKVRFFSRKEA